MHCLTGGRVQLLEVTYILDPVTDIYSAGWKTELTLTSDNIEIKGVRGTILKIKTGVSVEAGCGVMFFCLIGVNNGRISNIYFDGNSANVTAQYIIATFLYTTNTNVSIDTNYFKNTKYAIWGDGSNSTNSISIFNNIFDSTAGGCGLHNVCFRSIVSNNIFISPSVGIFIDSVSDVIIEKNVIYSPTGLGIYLFDNVNTCIIQNNIITGYATGAPWAIDIYTNTGGKPESSYNLVQNNIITTGFYGIRVKGTGNIIRNNILYNLSHAALVDFGENTIITGNSGYVTENTGTATIEAGQTSLDVTHGLAAAPTRVLLSPTTATAAGKQYYVSAKAATTFTITIDSEAEAEEDISFDWQAMI